MATVLSGDKLGTKEEKRASEMRQNEPEEWAGQMVWGLVATVLSVIWLPDSFGRTSALFLFMYPSPPLPPKTGSVS